jgi:thiol-disulfide isomerase/thioredoxin
MRNIRLALCLLAVFCTHLGCSQTGGVRPGSPSNMRTVASVGDKPLPSVSGEPGASLRADADDLDLPPSSGSRISGRVYDERGKPVPNAKVRLAVTSTPGGKAVYATTERSGAFTLHGLRPGTSYAVIAEYQGQEGMMTGRAQAKAPQANVRITLQPRAGESGQGHASIQPARPRVEPISNIDPVEDENSDDARSRGGINAEDLDLPAGEATAIAPRRNNVRISRTGNDNASAPVRGGWNSRQVKPDQTAKPTPKSQEPSDEAVPAASRATRRDEPGTNLDDDGPNPLPPALDTTEVSSREPTDELDERPIKVARASTRSSAGLGRRSAPRPPAQADDKAIGIMDQPGEREPRSMPEDILPGTKVISPASSAPIAVDEGSESDSAPARSSGGSRRSQAPEAGRATNPADDTESSRPPDPEPATIEGAFNSDARPTWAEVARNQSQVPLDESIQRTAADAPAAGDQGVVTLTGKAPPARAGLARFLGGSKPPADEAVQPAVCRFDPSKRKLVDFQLPGVDGKTISMRDIDADAILLDFWGSWCAPCRTSIAHLTELQKSLGCKRLQVIGIACEKGASLRDRQASAAKAMQELGINYPVLLSSKEGSCPLQQALQIQFYPTMILLDREGKLLAREQGATEVTMSRMDRAIQTALRDVGDSGETDRAIR